MSRTKSYVMDLEEKLNEREREIRRRRRELAEFGVSVRTINKKEFDEDVLTNIHERLNEAESLIRAMKVGLHRAIDLRTALLDDDRKRVVKKDKK
jgi:DNA repair ATPase RecN